MMDKMNCAGMLTDREEFVHRLEKIKTEIDRLRDEEKELTEEYLSKHKPFEAGWKNQVLCEVSYDYHNDPYDREHPDGTVSGIVYVTGFELAEIYGKKWRGHVIPQMLRVCESNPSRKEGVHFKLSTDFDTLRITPVNTLRDEPGESMFFSEKDSEQQIEDASVVVRNAPILSANIKDE